MAKEELDIIKTFQTYALQNATNPPKDFVPITLKDILNLISEKIESEEKIGEIFKKFPRELKVLVGLLTRNTRSFYELSKKGLEGITEGYIKKINPIEYVHIHGAGWFPIFTIKRFYSPLSHTSWFLDELLHMGVRKTIEELIEEYDKEYTLVTIVPLINKEIVLFPTRDYNTYILILSVASLMRNGEKFMKDEKNKVIEHFSKIILKHRRDIINYVFGYLEKIVETVYKEKDDKEKLLEYLGSKKKKILDIINRFSYNRSHKQDSPMKKIVKRIQDVLEIYPHKASKIMAETLTYVLSKIEKVLKKEIKNPEYKKFLKSKYRVVGVLGTREDVKEKDIKKYISKFLKGIREELYYLVRSIEDADIYLNRFSKKKRKKVLPYVYPKVGPLDYHIPIGPFEPIEEPKVLKRALETIENSWGVFNI